MDKKFRMGQNDIGAKDLAAVNSLLKQLNPKAESIGLIEVGNVVHNGKIITVRDTSKDDLLIGMGTLIPIRKLFSFCGTIEDIVVDEEYRGGGIGREIIMALVSKSKEWKMKFVDLTSRPSRKKANELYESIGFERRDTNIYRLYRK